jgi:hypothetical protein
MMIKKLKPLFIAILTEHAVIQVVVYLILMAAVMTALIHHPIPPAESFAISFYFVLFLKIISAILSLLKSAIIIIGCRRGDHEFLGIYKEWTGSEF